MTEQAGLLTPQEKSRLLQKQFSERRIHLEPIIDNPVFLIGLGFVHYMLAYLWRTTSMPIFNALTVIMWLAAIFLGVYFALNKRYPLIYSAYMVAYFAGCEVMWRQGQFTVFWEGGKYYVIVVLLAAWLRSPKRHIPMGAMLFLLAMIPGLLYSGITAPGDFRAAAANTASGPIAIFAAIVFFSEMKVSRDELRRMFILFIVPVVTIAGVTSYQLYFSNIVWTGDSNNELSGFGANQVSSALGLAWFLGTIIVLLLLDRKRFGQLFPLFLVGIPWFVAQNFLTFSRGGLLGAGIALVFVVVHMISIPGRRLMVIVGLAVSVVLILVIFPILDNTTQGNLSRRYTEADEVSNLSNRDTIIANEIQLFIDNPFTGVGLGRSKSVRESYGFLTANAHTEYSRVLAEQGIIGIGTNILFVVFSIQAYRKQQTKTGRAIAVGLIAWALVYMFHAATRTVAPAVTFGLAHALLAWDAADTADRIDNTRSVIPFSKPIEQPNA